MQVSRWDGSLAVRLPAAVVDALGLKEGDDIEIQIAGSRTLEIVKKQEAHDALSRLRKFRGRLPPKFRIDRLEANSRG